jgi:hypothetical protein
LSKLILKVIYSIKKQLIIPLFAFIF